MKISIVTISYNQAQFLNECIDSVLSQGYLDIEYIIVDPGSTDGSREIIKSYGSKVVSIFEPDAGPADGLNKGFNLATGDIFCYLNSDDLFLPQAFDSAINYFISHPNSDVICGHSHIINEKSNLRRYVYSDSFGLKEAAYGAVTILQPSTFFRKEAFLKSGGFNIDNRSNWDGELIIDMALSGARIDVIDVFLSCYRIHNESITGSARMAEAHVSHSLKMFEKIMGRTFLPVDKWWRYYYLLKKHIFNPKATIERLHKGPIFGVVKN